MSSGEAVTRTLSMEPVESPPDDARVRHVDELSERELDRFYRLVRTGQTAAAGEFVDGEVIVFTGYYRVEPS